MLRDAQTMESSTQTNDRRIDHIGRETCFDISVGGFLLRILMFSPYCYSTCCCIHDQDRTSGQSLTSDDAAHCLTTCRHYSAACKATCPGVSLLDNP